jgi:hypothetical protein
LDVVLLEETFEDPNLSGWELIGAWGHESGALSDSPGGSYPRNNRASATRIEPISFEGREAARLQFDLASFEYEPGWDFLLLEYSQDGTNWRTIDRYTGSLSGRRVYDLGCLSGRPSVQFRFVSLCDFGFQDDGARIDDFTVMAREATCTGDTDCDGIVDGSDNCPFTANHDQMPSLDDAAIGWACLCGDVNDDGTVDASDVDAFRDFLRGVIDFTPVGQRKCTVIGAVGDCDVLDATVIRRGVAGPGLQPGIQQVCEAAVAP